MSLPAVAEICPDGMASGNIMNQHERRADLVSRNSLPSECMFKLSHGKANDIQGLRMKLKK